MNNKIFLLDAYALIFRAYYAMMRNPRYTTTGLNTSAIMGFVLALQDVIKKEQPSRMAVCFDPPGGTFRHEEYKDYKANREATPEDIKSAVPYIKRILEAWKIPVFEVPGFEADDVIGTLAKRAAVDGFDTFMMTPDKDFGQLVGGRIKQYKPARGGAEPEVLGEAEINALYGITSPQQIIDILALWGDQADNIPGCPGIGEVRAKKLVQQFGTVENLLANTDKIDKAAQQRAVIENADLIRLSKHLATIRTDVPIDWNPDALLRVPADKDALRRVFAELEFKSLAARLIDHGEADLGITDIETDNFMVAQSSDTQLSLFDVPADEQPSEDNTRHLDNVEHDFAVVSDDLEATDLIARLAADEKTLGMHLVADGDEAMRSTLVGLAVCEQVDGRYVARYMPNDAMGWMTAALAPLFTGRATLVSNNVKRDIVALHAAGLAYSAPYYDTAVAHYVLHPESKHSPDVIALHLLNYKALPPVISEAKSRTAAAKRLMSAVPGEKLAEWACEQAMLALMSREPLDDALKREQMAHLNTDIEQPLVNVLADMEMAGVRIDVNALADISRSLTARMEQLDAECQQMAGRPFNTASPAQVGEVLFGDLQLDPKAKRTKTGQFSTTEEILMKHIDKHPIVAKILDLRGVRKLLSTYVDALPALINPRTGRVHTTFMQTVTATGRLSSVNPNLQNIPVRNDDGREIRRAFIPAEGNRFFSADYSQIELRLVADFSEDTTMLEAFANGDDIHAITAARIYHLKPEEVTPDQRRHAKTANFGILYGISAFGLSSRLMISRAESKALIDGYFRSFPQVKAYIDRSVAEAKENGYVTTKYGRRRLLPDINSRNAVVRGYSERNAVNAPIQGTAADIIKIAMVNIHRRFKEQGIRSKMILQVHDELNFDVLPNEVEQVTQIVTTEMEKAYSGRVSLVAGYGVADNWLDAH